MELYHLKTFITVAEEGRMTRAAQRLNTSQPAVSAHIKALEEELGILLFTRTPKGMRLTQEGMALKTQAEKALSTIDNLLDLACNLKDKISGTLKLGLHIDPRYLRIDHLLSHLRESHGQLEFHLLQRWSWQQFEDLPKGEIDAGFVYGTPTNKEIETIRLNQCNIRIVGPAAWKERLENADWQEMAAMPWVWTPPNCSLCAAATTVFEKRGLKPVKITLADHEPAVAALVASGIGLGYMIEEEAMANHEEGKVSVWGDVVGTVDLNFAYCRKRKREAIIRAAIEGVRLVWEGAEF